MLPSADSQGDHCQWGTVINFVMALIAHEYCVCVDTWFSSQLDAAFEYMLHSTCPNCGQINIAIHRCMSCMLKIFRKATVKFLGFVWQEIKWLLWYMSIIILARRGRLEQPIVISFSRASIPAVSSSQVRINLIIKCNCTTPSKYNWEYSQLYATICTSVYFE